MSLTVNNPTPIYFYQYNELVFETYNEKPTHLSAELKEVNQTHSCLQQSISEINQEPADAINFLNQELSIHIPVIRTADCLPIWISTNSRNYLIHAGWRGLANKIISKCVMREEVRFILIGPSICAACFEVQEDFLPNFPNSNFFQKTNTKLTFNLVKQAKLEIQTLNLSNKVSIVESKKCTFEDSRLHSFRKNATAQRNWSIVRRAS